MKLLIVRNDRMGDLLMSLPAVREVRSAFPYARLTLLVRKGLEPLLQPHPDLDHLWVWDPAQGQGFGAILRWGFRFRREHFDAALILNPTRLFHAASFLAGIPIRAGYRRKWGFLLNRAVPDTKSARDLHESEYNLEIVRLLGIPSREPVLSLPERSEADQEARRILESRGVPFSVRPVALHPWTSNPVKGWPMESFRELAGRLVRSGQTILWIGEPEGKDFHPPESSQGINLTGQVPLRLLPALLRCCAVLVSNDSGPVHVAAAVGTPVVVVAPETHARLLARWRPLGNGHRLLLSPGVEEVAAAASSAAAQGER